MTAENPRLGAILRHAALSVPRFRGLAPRLDAFPITRKAEILADLPGHVSDDGGVDKARLTAFLQDGARKRDSKDESVFDRRIVVDETSGSNGVPFCIPKTVEERARCSIGIWRYRSFYDPEASPETFYPLAHEPIGFRHEIPPGVGSPRDVGRLYDHLSARGVRWIHANPPLLERHARAMVEPAAARSLAFAETSGSYLTAEARDLIERRMNVRVVDQYGCREVWAIGTKTGDGPFTVVKDNVHLEIVDDAGRPIREPGVAGRVVVTSLIQKLLPFVRYDTGDIAEWASPEPGDSFVLSESRQHNMLQTARGRVSGNALFKTIFIAAYREMGNVGVRYVQVRQVGRRGFVVATNRFPEAEALCATVQRLFNRRELLSGPAAFAALQLGDGEVERALQEKPCLFTTRGYRPKTGLAELCDRARGALGGLAPRLRTLQ